MKHSATLRLMPSSFSDEYKIEPITTESLKSEKAYIKLARKQQKELDSQRRKHHKEKTVIQKQQCSAIDKTMKNLKKYKSCLISFNVKILCAIAWKLFKVESSY